MNQQDICKDIANLHDNIFAAGIIEDQQLVAKYTKLNHPIVDEERSRLMFAQPDIVLSIFKTAEDHFGTLHYFIVCFENSDFLFFPSTVDEESRIFYVRMKRTFRGEEILQKVYDYLESSEGKQAEG